MALVSTPWSGARDLADARVFLSALWRQEGPHVPLTVCDLDWRPYQRLGIDLTECVRLWRDPAGALVGFAWFTPPDEVEMALDPRHREMNLLGQVLEWAAAKSRGAGSGAPPAIWAVESDVAVSYLLARLGYTASSHRYAHLFLSTSADSRDRAEGAARTPAAKDESVPPGSAYTIRTTRPDEIVARVDVHRSAFAPSQVTVDSYRQLTQCAGYERDLDLVAVAPDGTLAAFAIGWLDAENHLGVIEPVGTRPDHRRRGLAKFVTREVMRRLRQRGATSFMLYTRMGSTAHRVYAPLGFHTVTTSIRFEPPLG